MDVNMKRDQLKTIADLRAKVVMNHHDSETTGSWVTSTITLIKVKRQLAGNPLRI